MSHLVIVQNNFETSKRHLDGGAWAGWQCVALNHPASLIKRLRGLVAAGWPPQKEGRTSDPPLAGEQPRPQKRQLFQRIAVPDLSQRRAVRA
jgi:hypothetical protein